MLLNVKCEMWLWMEEEEGRKGEMSQFCIHSGIAR